MDNLMLDRVRELLEKSEDIGIAVGANPGIDEMGAALALYLSLFSSGKSVAMVSPTEPIVELSSLVGINKVKKGFDGEQGDLTVSFPYKDGEIEKISYTLEGGKLNILVKAGEKGLSFDQNDIEYKRSAGAPKLVFVIGTPRLSDLGRVFDPQALKDSTLINIDYRENNQGFGDIVLVNKNSSSVCEMMASLISSLGLKIDIDIASNLLMGITFATQNFQKENTSPLSFEMAGFLMKKGARREAKSLPKKQDTQAEKAYSFFTPKLKPQIPTFSKTTIGTEEKTAAFAKGSGELKDENNPPDDWLAPKIYKGSTSI